MHVYYQSVDLENFGLIKCRFIIVSGNTFLCWHLKLFFSETVEIVKFIYGRMPQALWYRLSPWLQAMIHDAKNNVKAKMLEKTAFVSNTAQSPLRQYKHNSNSSLNDNQRHYLTHTE